MSMRYEQDFYQWTQEQAGLLRAGRLEEIDVANVIEELESLGRSEKRLLIILLGRLLQHLLKWQLQPVLRCRCFEITIRNLRRDVAELLEESASLRLQLEECLRKAYSKARGWVEVETGFPEILFSEQCPWSYAEVMNAEFLPD